MENWCIIKQTNGYLASPMVDHLEYGESIVFIGTHDNVCDIYKDLEKKGDY